MAQGWNINPTTDFITFLEPPPTGVNNIVVTEYARGAVGGTDVFAVGAWSARYGYPGEGEFYGDRLWLANTPADPQTVWGSCIGDYTNFGRSSPIVDSDAVTFAVNARQVNRIKDLVPLDSFLLMTVSGEYKMTGGADDVVTPSTIGVKNQNNAGIGDLPAIVIGESAVMIQREGQKVRDLAYKFEKDGFRGTEISVWADHLFFRKTITAVEYWKSPWQVLFFARSDGVMVGCTYMPEQEVIGWHQHDTDGQHLDVCSLPGDSESELYFLTQRSINGEVVQYIEQQAETEYDTESDLFYVDAGLTYDGRNSTATTITLSTADDWTEDGNLTITASAALFVGASDEGDGFELWRDVTTVVDGLDVVTRHSVRLFIDSFTDATHVAAHSVGTVPAELRNLALSSWTFRRDTIGGLWHLEGKSVSVLQDGGVAGPFVVTDGQISLATPGGVVHVGLPYTAEVETLELNAAGGESMRDQNKLAYNVKILLLASRGVLAGGVTGDLYPVKTRRFEDYGQPPFLHTGVVEAPIPAGWGEDAGRVRIVSTDPLPMEILSITTKAVSSNK